LSLLAVRILLKYRGRIKKVAPLDFVNFLEREIEREREREREREFICLTS